MDGMKETTAGFDDVINLIEGLKIAETTKQGILEMAQEKKNGSRDGLKIMSYSQNVAAIQKNHMGTVCTDPRFCSEEKWAKRAAKKRQRHLEEVKMLAEGVFLLAVGMSIGGVGILLLGAVIAVLG